MSNRIITISREFGSGGRTIGRNVAKRLGIPCYDAELIEKISEESGFDKDFVRERGEQAAYKNRLANLFVDRDLSGLSIQDHLWKAQSKVIRNLAEKESCVIVGRCAEYILRDTADCLTVFIHADPEFRAQRIVQVYGEREESPKKRILGKDKRRKIYYEYYTDMQWGDATNHHICLDSGVLGIDRCVDLIAGLY